MRLIKYLKQVTLTLKSSAAWPLLIHETLASLSCFLRWVFSSASPLGAPALFFNLRLWLCFFDRLELCRLKPNSGAIG